jgi:hypothetical protein
VDSLPYRVAHLPDGTARLEYEPDHRIVIA